MRESGGERERESEEEGRREDISYFFEEGTRRMCNERWGKTGRERGGKRESEKEIWEKEGEEMKRARRLSRGREEDGKRVTQAESGPRGQFLGAINDEPTERGHTRIFLRFAGRRAFRTCTALNPDITGREFSIARLYLVGT